MEGTLWIYLLLVIIILYVVQVWRQKQVLKRCQLKESSSRKVPVLEHAINFLGSSEDNFRFLQNLGQEATKNGGLVAIRLVTDLIVLVSDPVKAEFLMKTCLDKGDYIKPIREIIGYGSIFAPVEFWRPRRKMVVPTFTPRNLGQFLTVFIKQSTKMAEILGPQVGKGPFSIWPYLTSFTFDTICESTLGFEVNSQTNPDHPFLIGIAEGTELACRRLLNPLLHNSFVYKFTKDSKKFNGYRSYGHDFIYQIISTRRIESEKNHNNGFIYDKEHDGFMKPFIQLLLESSDEVSDIELMEETGVLLVAATDTSALSASFCLLLLAAHPEIQKKVYKEVKEVTGNLDRPLTIEDLAQLKYLECVIKETLRLYPSAPFITRKTETDVTLPSGETLPKNTNILLGLWAIHRNPKYWGEDAETFRPERFLEPFTHPAQYMAFSYGPRNCIGYRYALMVLKTAFVNILQRYVIKPSGIPPFDQWKTNHRPMRLKLDILLKSADDFLVQLEERK